MRRAARPLALALIALGLGAGALCFVAAVDSASVATRAVLVAAALVDLAAMTGATFLIWPRGAR